MSDNRKALQGATDAELEALWKNLLSDLMPQHLKYVPAELDREPVPAASAEVIHGSDPAPTPFTKNDETASKIHFDWLNGRCVPGKEIN
jgi:hypothetical protein